MNPDDREKSDRDDVLVIEDARKAVEDGENLKVLNITKNESYEAGHTVSSRQIGIMPAGSLMNVVKQLHRLTI